MKSAAILDEVVEIVRAIPARLSGDDSPLSDPWEEVKDQVQHGASVFWDVYVESMQDIIDGIVRYLSPQDYSALAAELDIDEEDIQWISEEILNLLLARAASERIGYEPFEFTHFRYSLYGMTVYAQVLERTGLFACRVVAYSVAAPSGERGEVNTDIIESTLSQEEFARARQLQWPEKWEESRGAGVEEPDWNIYDEVAREAAISEDEARRASEALLKALHRRLVEYRGMSSNYLFEMAPFELSNRAFYHLLGFVEQFSRHYSWDEGIIVEYLARLLPAETCEALADEIADWHWADE